MIVTAPKTIKNLFYKSEPMNDKNNALKTEDYGQFLNRIKKDIQRSQIKAALAVNQELILLYWRIGKGLIEKIDHEKWGSKIITTIASDLARSFRFFSSKFELYEKIC